MSIQLFRERLSEEMCTLQSRKVIWDMINTLFLTLQLSSLLLLFSFSIRKQTSTASVPFFQISLKNSELKPPTIPFGIVACTLQPFSKQLYIRDRFEYLNITYTLMKKQLQSMRTTFLAPSKRKLQPPRWKEALFHQDRLALSYFGPLHLHAISKGQFSRKLTPPYSL